MPNTNMNNITAIIAVANITINGMLYTANINFKIKDKIVYVSYINHRLFLL